MTAGPADRGAPVRAAGTVLWRGTGDDIEVALVHRPRYGDWSLPKGKCTTGETAPACAVRETTEETGWRPVLGRQVGEVWYPLENGRTKWVIFFAGRAGEGEFTPNDEVDEMRWLPVSAALRQTSYGKDRGIITRFAALPADPPMVLMVRHAKAGRRSDWLGEDDRRPLSPAGMAQAAALGALLPLFGVDRVHAAPLVRCMRTVAPLAAAIGVRVAVEPTFADDAFAAEPEASAQRLVELSGTGGRPAVCSQGETIPGLVDRFATDAGVTLDGLPCKKGSVWLLSFQPDAPGRLISADYLPSALGTPSANTGTG